MTMLKPLWLQAGSHSAVDARLAMSAQLGIPTTTLTRSGGVIPGYAGVFAVTQTGSPSMGVLVAAGAVQVPGTTSASQGAYSVVNDASVTLSIAAAHASLARIDVVVARVYDSTYSGASDLAAPEIVTGTPAGSPSVPAIPASSIKLYEVAVAAGATSIVNGNLTDRRVWAVGVGGVHPCLSTARPANPYAGMPIYETNTNLPHLYTGTAWKQLMWGDDTGVVNVSAGSGWSVSSYCTVRRIGPIVQARWILERTGGNLAANADSTLFTLDTQYRPAGTVPLAVEANLSTATEGMVEINTSGTAVVTNHDAINTGQFTAGSGVWLV